MDRTTAHDAALVASALDGDTSAFAEIYDRYADRVFTMCAHLLSSRHDAADVCGDVFLIAAERLGQLRDPSRLKPWLFAIARRQVYLRTRRRSRHVLFGELDDMSQSLPSDEVGAGAEAAELAALLREASAGLDDTDRVVLELTLQGLDGNDLADALGVSANNAYQASHRMKERLERSVGALLVARQGRADCSDLDAVLHTWDGRFSVLWRKRVARHVDGCDVCGERRRAVPVLLFRGVAGAAPPFAAAPSIRTRVLGAANVGAGSARPWPGDGFPPPDRRHRRLAAFIGAAAVLVMVVTGAVVGVALTGGDGGGPVATVTSTDAPAAQPGDTAAGPSSPTST
jgi:RNA polymerase sigma factor (sigma-70 family)